jgi:tRNA G18 (ribose-2'-O)-methylase SpoU
MREIAVVLPNIRSAHNVGSIFRTADGAGVSRIYLAGYTPRPVDRFGRIDKTLSKTALGAEKTVAWERHREPSKLLRTLKAEGWHIVGVEQDKRSRDYRSSRAKGKTAFVFGNEVRGLSRTLRSLCDELIEIPMHGTKESLNVSVAAGIVLFSTIRTLTLRR